MGLSCDHDGVLDCREDCPDDPAKTSPGKCGCGIPDSDRDFDSVVDCLDEVGLGALAVTSSPVTGAKGNREFLIHLRPGPSSVTAAALEEATT